MAASATMMDATADAAAREADRLLAVSAPGRSLLGIPLAVKDNLRTKGIPTEAGSRVLAGWIPDNDASAVTRLHDAGSVIVGKTMMHEFAFGVNSPRTRSPWGADLFPGGRAPARVSPSRSGRRSPRSAPTPEVLFAFLHPSTASSG